MRARGILTEASTYVVANVVNAAIPFLLLPILTRVMSSSELGLVATFQGMVTLLGAFVGVSTQGSVGIHFHQLDREAFRRLLGAVLVILAGSLLLVTGVVVAADEVLERWTGLGPGLLVCTVAVSACQFIITTRLVLWQMGHQAWRYAAYQLLLSAINAALSLYLVLGLQWEAAGRIYAIVIASGIMALGSLALFLFKGEVARGWDGGSLRVALAYGAPLVPHVLGGVAIGLADRFVVTRQLGTEATGGFYVAMQLALPLIIIGDGVNRAFVPWLFARLARGDKIQAVGASYLMMAVFLLLGFAYAFASLWIMPWFVGPKFAGMRGVTAILALGAAFQGCYLATVNYLFYIGRTGVLSSVTLTCGVLYVVGGWHLCGAYGLTAFAVWYAIIQFLLFVTVWIFAARLCPMPWFSFAAVTKELAGYLGGVRDSLSTATPANRLTRVDSNEIL